MAHTYGDDLYDKFHDARGGSDLTPSDALAEFDHNSKDKFATKICHLLFKYGEKWHYWHLDNGKGCDAASKILRGHKDRAYKRNATGSEMKGAFDAFMKLVPEGIDIWTRDKPNGGTYWYAPWEDMRKIYEEGNEPNANLPDISKKMVELINDKRKESGGDRSDALPYIVIDKLLDHIDEILTANEAEQEVLKSLKSIKTLIIDFKEGQEVGVSGWLQHFEWSEDDCPFQEQDLRELVEEEKYEFYPHITANTAFEINVLCKTEGEIHSNKVNIDNIKSHLGNPEKLAYLHRTTRWYEHKENGVMLVYETFDECPEFIIENAYDKHGKTGNGIGIGNNTGFKPCSIKDATIRHSLDKMVSEEYRNRWWLTHKTILQNKGFKYIGTDRTTNSLISDTEEKEQAQNYNGEVRDLRKPILQLEDILTGPGKTTVLNQTKRGFSPHVPVRIREVKDIKGDMLKALYGIKGKKRYPSLAKAHPAIQKHIKNHDLPLYNMVKKRWGVKGGCKLSEETLAIRKNGVTDIAQWDILELIETICNGKKQKSKSATAGAAGAAGAASAATATGTTSTRDVEGYQQTRHNKTKVVSDLDVLAKIPSGYDSYDSWQKDLFKILHGPAYGELTAAQYTNYEDIYLPYFNLENLVNQFKSWIEKKYPLPTDTVAGGAEIAKMVKKYEEDKET